MFTRSLPLSPQRESTWLVKSTNFAQQATAETFQSAAMTQKDVYTEPTPLSTGGTERVYLKGRGKDNIAALFVCVYLGSLPIGS